MSANNGVTIQLPQFEGPLALLLYLIRKEEMDIMDIQVHKITHQYFEYIKLMKELDLEVAGEFVSMAATLIQIKSRMLLPQYGENGEVVENEDPRKELVQRLLEYQKYQEAARSLYERPLLGRDVWARGLREKIEAKEEEVVVEDNPVFSLISAYRRAVRAAKKKIHQVAIKLQSIADRIVEIKDRLLVGHKVAMSSLITVSEGRNRQILITFLSVLELGKMGFVSLFQTDSYHEIYIEAKKAIEHEAISNVEEYGYVEYQLALEPSASFNQVASDVHVDLSAEDVADQNQIAVEAVTIETVSEEVASDEEIAQAERELGEYV